MGLFYAGFTAFVDTANGGTFDLTKFAKEALIFGVGS